MKKISRLPYRDHYKKNFSLYPSWCQYRENIFFLEEITFIFIEKSNTSKWIRQKKNRNLRIKYLKYYFSFFNFFHIFIYIICVINNIFLSILYVLLITFSYCCYFVINNTFSNSKNKIHKRKYENKYFYIITSSSSIPQNFMIIGRIIRSNETNKWNIFYFWIIY